MNVKYENDQWQGKDNDLKDNDSKDNDLEKYNDLDLENNNFEYNKLQHINLEFSTVAQWFFLASNSRQYRHIEKTVKL